LILNWRRPKKKSFSIHFNSESSHLLGRSSSSFWTKTNISGLVEKREFFIFFI
jgi:hypothetical protein